MSDDRIGGASQAALFKLLNDFAEAYNRHDVDAIMDFMTDDCVFVSFFGPDADGQRFVGFDKVRQRVAAGLADFSDSRWTDAKHFVSGDRGITQWLFTGTRRGTAERLERRGVDVFTFRDGKIWVKDTYQKMRQPADIRKEIQVPSIHRPVGRYAHAVRYRDMLFISGCGPFDRDAKLVGGGDIVAQMAQTPKNVKAILEAAGAGFANVIKETVYLTDSKDGPATRVVRERFYGPILPAATLVEIGRCVNPDMKIEIDVMASF